MYLTFPPPSLVLNQLSGQLESKGSQTICRKDPINESSTSSLLSSTLHCTIDPVRRRWAFAAWVFIYSVMGRKRDAAQEKSF